MSRRTINRDRLATAGLSAVAADAWVAADRRAVELSDHLGPTDARCHGPTLAVHPRLEQRWHTGAAPLVDLFIAHPKLASWLASPEALGRLIRFTGAAVAGGPMAAVVNRFEVSVLIASLGEDVWRFGLDHATPDDDGASASVGQPTFVEQPISIEQIVATIEVEGCRAVRAALEHVSPDFAADAFAAAAVECDGGRYVPADAMKRVLMVTERAEP